MFFLAISWHVVWVFAPFREWHSGDEQNVLHLRNLNADTMRVKCMLILICNNCVHHAIASHNCVRLNKLQKWMFSYKIGGGEWFLPLLSTNLYYLTLKIRCLPISSVRGWGMRMVFVFTWIKYKHFPCAVCYHVMLMMTNKQKMLQHLSSWVWLFVCGLLSFK